MIEDDCYVWVYIRCKICLTLEVFANSSNSSLKPLSLSLELSHYKCPLKLTDLWIISLLFDLNYKLINGSFAFITG